MYKSILIAIDGSDQSISATQETLNIINSTSEVTLLTVINKDSIAVDPFQEDHSLDTLHYYKQSLKSFASILESAGCTVKLYAIEGNPQEQVVKWANSGKFDVIVLGAQGIHPIRNRLLGSVSQSVIMKVDIPVLVVKNNRQSLSDSIK